MASTEQLEKDIFELRQKLKQKEELLAKIKNKEQIILENKLTKEEIRRFSRQIILPEVGVKGQLKLKNSSVLIVGAGGLGCPAALYLVGAGIGTIGIVDYDLVEVNNLHRQLLHTEASLGTPKAESAKESLLKLNSSITINVHNIQLDSDNALEILESYDIVLDATDNVATRYLLNDACVLLQKPLVSGSAIKLEGQLTVYNYMNGPCYRCVFPIPPPPETVTNCGDGGVVGAVPGILGTMQALEAIKIILEMDEVLSGRLVIFDGARGTFRTVRLRGKRERCDVCSEKPIITRLIDYEQFCGMRASDKDFKLNILEENERISCKDYKQMMSNPSTHHILIDVRSANEFEICHLPDSVNIPIKDVLDNKISTDISTNIIENKLPIVVVCRRGNDSQLAVKYLQKLYPNSKTKDIAGGLYSWASNVDFSFPIY